MKITARLILLFLLISLIPLLIVSISSYNAGRVATEEATLARLQAINQLKEAEFNRWIESEVRSLRSLASRPSLREDVTELTAHENLENIATQPAYLRIFEDHLAVPLEKESGFIELFVLQPDSGQVIFSTDRRELGKFRTNEPYFEEGKQAPFIQNIYYSITRGESLMTISTPIVDKQDNLIAVLAGHVSLGEMTRIMTQRSSSNTTEETYLVNKYNFFVTEDPFEPETAFSRAIHTEAIDTCLQHNDGIGYYLSHHDLPVLGVYRWLPERELCILTEISEAEAFAPILTQRNTLVGVGTGMVVIILLTVTYFARSITRPIYELVTGTQEVGHGKLDYHIDVKTEDEIGQLATAFNEMAANLSQANQSLKHHQNNLEMLVAERTAALEASTRELQRSNEELEQFAYVASHDLQEPLRMVSSYLQLLSRRYEGKLDADADLFIEYAVDGALRMKVLINDLLTYSRVGTRGREFKPTKSQTVLDQTLAMLQLAIQENQATISCDALPTVLADSGQLGQLFQNLIGNALKFHSDEPVMIHIGAESQNGEWLFSVKDNGIGMDPKYKDRIFAIFQRLHTREEYSGTGIGLAVCKKIVERHNGRIWVESEPGKGSTFFFTMPKEVNNEHLE